MQNKKPLRILVALDLSEMDAYIIDYVRSLGTMFEISEITFLHNIKLEDLSREFLSTTVLNDVYQKVKAELRQKIKKTGLEIPNTIVVRMEAFTEAAFEEQYKRKHFDLLILGRKRNLQGSGSLAHKLLQLFPGATLIVPQNFKTPVKTIVEAITFSKYTALVLGWGARLHQNQKQEAIRYFPVHISKPFYTPLIPRDYETSQVFKTDVQRKKEKWKELQYQRGELEILSCEDESIADALSNYIQEKEADILILGVRGESKVRELFMGSVASDLLNRPLDTALLFVKPTV